VTVALLGLLALAAGVLLLKWYADADVKTLKKSIRWTGVTLLVLIILVLAATGRLGAAYAVLVGALGWIWRVFNFIQMGRQMSGMFRSFGFNQGFAGFGGGGNAHSSQVESAFLAMTLDHRTGEMDGKVRRGTFEGRVLSELNKDEVSELSHEVQSDHESAQLLDAFIERTHPDWREEHGTADSDGGGSSPQSSAMSDDEARRILGVSEAAGEPEIKAAYRKLMAQLHPDKGGSDYLAAKVNQAKELLLKRHD